MSTGEPIRLRAAMKPFSTVPKPLATVDLVDGGGRPSRSSSGPTSARCRRAAWWARRSWRSCSPNAVLEKFGGDSLRETRATSTATWTG